MYKLHKDKQWINKYGVSAAKLKKKYINYNLHGHAKLLKLVRNWPLSRYL